MSDIPGACAQCQATGLPIVPVRYAVVPAALIPGRPAWAGGERVTSVEIGAEFKYALRTLRTGFVYLFHASHPTRGNNHWECYSVCQDGSLTLHATPQAAQPDPYPTLQCARIAHLAAARHALVIPQPEKSGLVWIAFSQHLWSEEALEAYTSDPALRSARMQSFEPAKLILGAAHPHATEATREVLEGVLEYASTTDTHTLPHDQDAGDISLGEDGTYRVERLRQVSTLFPWAMRTDTADASAAHLHQRAKSAGARPGKPQVFALWDAVGIVRELNGYRNDAAGWIAKYDAELALPLGAVANYDALQAALERRAAAEADANIDPYVAFHNPKREPQAPGRPRDIPPDFPESESWREDMAALDRLRNSRSQAARRRAEQAKAHTIAAAWPKYAARLDPRLPAFRRKIEEFSASAAAVAESRTQALVHWLDAPLFLDTLADFHGQSPQDGVLFEELIGEAIFGMQASPSGRKKIDAWLADAKASTRGNLLWRAVALNHDDVRRELDANLAEAERHRGQKTLASALNWTGYVAKTLKALADIYKKVSNAPVPAGGIRGADKLLMTVGDRIFNRYGVRAVADYASEKIIQYVLSIRGLVSVEDSLRLIETQATYDQISRTQTLRRLQASRAFLAMDTPEVQSMERDHLKRAWRDFKPTPGGQTALKNARLATLVLLIEALNFSKLSAECALKKDARSQLSLLASAMSISGALLDIASAPIKAMTETGGEKGWSFGRLKILGGLLSGSATVIGGVLDFMDAKRAADQGYWLLKVATRFKGAVGFGSGALAIASTFTYVGVFIGRVTGKALLADAMGAIGNQALAWLGIRIFGLTLSTQLTIGLFALQIIVWQITPTAIEKWLDHSAFGAKRANGGYANAEAQNAALREALVEMGLE